jgi:hypothetical protein
MVEDCCESQPSKPYLLENSTLVLTQPSFVEPDHEASLIAGTAREIKRPTRRGGLPPVFLTPS